MIHNLKINSVCNKAIIGISQGRMAALSDIYDSIGEQVYFMAYSILQDPYDSEDVVQQVLCEIVKSAGAYQPGTNARAWILSIARNLALKYRRDRKSYLSLEDMEDHAELTGSDMSMLSNLTMFDALKELSDEDQKIVLWHLECGLKFREIAELLKISHSAAQKKYQRALKKLKIYYTAK